MQTIPIRTQRRNELIDVTAKVGDTVRDSKLQEGMVLVYVPHTTAGVTINENADADVVHDLLSTLEELVPQRRAGYRHSEGNSDAHVKSSLVGSSVAVVVEGGRMCLGTWQGLYFCEFDGPRDRRMLVQVIGR